MPVSLTFLDAPPFAVGHNAAKCMSPGCMWHHSSERLAVALLDVDECRDCRDFPVHVVSSAIRAILSTREFSFRAQTDSVLEGKLSEHPPSQKRKNCRNL